MVLTKSDEEKLARLTMHDGWEVFTRLMRERIKAEHDTLTRADFDSLLDVGRCQGRAYALESAILFVERRGEKLRGG